MTSGKDGISATTFVTIKNAIVGIRLADDGIQVEDETDVNSGDLTITQNSTVTINATDKGIMVTGWIDIEEQF